MISYRQMRDVLRTRAKTLSVVGTGEIAMGATGSTYARSSGSFLDDGFCEGLELTASGFYLAANNGVSVITGVTATTVTVDKVLSTEEEETPLSDLELLWGDAGLWDGLEPKTLTVGLPALRAWENRDFAAVSSRPYVMEAFVPTPSRQVSVGPGGTLEASVIYRLMVCVPKNRGAEAADRYADALCELFTPRTAMTLDNGDVLRVRPNPGPYPGPLVPLDPSWATVPVTVPLWLHSVNSN